MIRARLLGVAALLCINVTAANAVTWQIQNAFLNGPDAGTLTGSFDYDSITNTISNINVTLSGLNYYNPIYNQHTEVSFTGLNGCSAPGCQSNVEFVSYDSGAWLDLNFTPYLSDASGVVAFTNLSAVHQIVYGELVSGELVATPLPTTLPLFASGLGALGLLGWRRKRKAAVIAA